MRSLGNAIVIGIGSLRPISLSLSLSLSPNSAEGD